MIQTPRELRNSKLAAKLITNLQMRHYDAYYCPTGADVINKVKEIIPEGSSISWGGSYSIRDIGLTQFLKNGNYDVYDRDDVTTQEDKIRIYRKAFECDFYLASVNAISEDGVIINIDGKKFVHMGDIGCELSASQLDQIKGCDVLMIPVGGFYTINARQAFAMTKDIDPRVVIPMHYRGKTFGYKEIATREEFEQLVLAKGDRKVIRHTSVFEDNDDYKCMVLLEPLRA